MSVTTDQHGRTLVIRIERPDARNAVNQQVAAGLERALDELEDTADLWVGIITAGGPVFCAGADLKVAGTGDLDAIFTDRGGFAGVVDRRRTKPLIAAVDGDAYGGGFEIALACDLIVASRSAQFALPEVAHSAMAIAGGLADLPAEIGAKATMELALLGDRVPAERLYGWGTIARLAEPGQVLAEAHAVAERICRNAPLAVRGSRRSVVDARDLDHAKRRNLANTILEDVKTSHDYREGLTAFAEKRQPRWEAR